MACSDIHGCDADHVRYLAGTPVEPQANKHIILHGGTQHAMIKACAPDYKTIPLPWLYHVRSDHFTSVLVSLALYYIPDEFTSN